MNITSFALNKDKLTIVFLICLVFAGWSSFKTLPRYEDPEFVIRTAVVKTEFPGASPQRVEQLITEKIERKIQEMPEINFITSISKTGTSLIYVDVKESYKDMDPIWDDLKDKVEDARADLPKGVTGPFVWDDFGDVFGIIIAITGDGFSYRQMREIAKDVRKELLLLPQVAKVEKYGEQEERIFVEISNARLARFGLSLAQIMDALGKENIVLPGGFINIASEKIVIEPTGTFESLEDIKQTIISVPESNDVVYLQDIADVKRGYVDPPSVIMHYNGQPSIGLAISMAQGGNVMNLGKDVEALVDRLYQEYPVGVNFEYVNYQPIFVETAINAFNSNLLQGVTIVILVMLLSLGLRTGLIIATLLPMVILATYTLMSVFNIPLQRVSIASLIIALGLIVDCAIVMCDHIIVRLEAGEDRKHACIEAANELKLPLLTSTLTTSAAFLPIAMAKSAVGEYCVSLFQVVSIALVSSWVLALTMIPFLCYCFLEIKKHSKENKSNIFKIIFSNTLVKIILLSIFFSLCIFYIKVPIIIIVIMLPFVYLRFFRKKKELTMTEEQRERYDTPFYRFYKKFLMCVLTHRIVSIGILVVMFFVAMQGFGFINKIFFPSSDRTQIIVDFRMPEGTNINQTKQSVEVLEKYLNTAEYVENYTTYIGDGGPRFYLSHNPEQNAENYAFILINVEKLIFVETLKERLRDFIKENIPESEATAKLLESGSPVGAPIQVRISGKDAVKLYELAEQVKDVLNDIPGTDNVRDDWGTKTKKIVIDINQAKAKRANISSEDIANSLQNQLSGQSSTDYREGDELIPIVIRSPEAYEKNLEKVESLSVYSFSSKVSVLLRQLAKIDLTWQPGTILRRDRKRTISVKSEVVGTYASVISKEFRPKMKELAKDWPFGYTYDIGGEDEESADAEKSIMDQFPFAIFLIIIMMVSQFNSFKKMAIIMITIPMGLIGVTVGLLVTGSDFGFMAMLGIISLSGIVINDAIVLLDRIRIEKDELGKPHDQAIIDAALSHTRPILLTSITTVGGLLPLALNGGALWSPMAYTIMFGLTFSTVLTLGLVPVLYSLFFGVKFTK